ncbi:MAG: copper chaperone PCu(A)C [Rhodobacteraceae bacterium]|nr:copper chaperone PCu(A)C [Paracoccaceae bacterium]
MSFKSKLMAATAAAILVSTSAFAADTIMVHDPYVRSSTAKSTSGAAFMVLKNTGTVDDRLIGARASIAKKVELHTHMENSDGVMHMMEIEGGIPIAAGDQHMMVRGGDHVMFMGLSEALIQGDVISLTLTFEKAGDVSVEVPVDHARKPADQGNKMQHGTDG